MVEGRTVLPIECSDGENTSNLRVGLEAHLIISFIGSRADTAFSKTFDYQCPQKTCIIHVRGRGAFPKVTKVPVQNLLSIPSRLPVMASFPQNRNGNFRF